jgi:phage protein U
MRQQTDSSVEALNFKLVLVSSQGMRHVASQKLVMNERQASSRTAAAAGGKDGHIMLGGAAVPEAVLRGKGLRALLDAQQQAAGLVPVGGLIDGE